MNGTEAYLFGDEEWRVIALNTKTTYMVSNYGRVRSLGARACILRQMTRRGYYTVSFGVNGSQKTLGVHRLVAMAFIGDRPEGLEINHVDGHKSNNASSNLEYVTSKQNIRHAFANGLRENTRGTRHRCNKLSEAQVREIIALLADGRRQQRDIASEYGVSQMTIHKIKAKKRWKHIRQ